MKDVHGQAILNYYKGDRKSKLILHNSYGEPEEMPIEVFFREPEDFTELENLAISSCRGSVLDIGAAAGAHALLLQALDMDITALDNSPGCQITLEKSGINNVVCEDYLMHMGKYDTLLLLMNGVGIVGKINNLATFFSHCKKLLNPGGQILLDSSDISYLYKDGLARPSGYFGEIQYRYEYQNHLGDWFDWVYIDPTMLKQQVSKLGLKLEILNQDDNDQYLCRVNGY